MNFQNFLPLNFSLLLFLGVILAVTYLLVRKSLFWPITQFDSITGYDFIAKAIVQEGAFYSSLFSAENSVYSIRSTYPPLVPINFAFAYLIGHSSSQIVVLMFFLSTIMSFYLLLKRRATHLCAAFFTFLLIIIPEYAAFATISSSNIPCVFYTSIGLLCLYIGFTEQNKNYFTIATLLIALAVWTRSEAVIFAAGGGMIILLNAVKNKKKNMLISFCIACVVPLILWQWYIKEILQVSSAQPLLYQLTWDYEKLTRMLHQIKLVTFSTQYYGATVLLFLGMVLINLKNIFRNKDNAVLLGSIFTAWILYIAIFYLIDTDYRSNTMEGWIFSGYKRGLFCFFPLFLFYSANNKISQKLFNEYFSLSHNK